MTVYVDDAIHPFGTMKMCHLFADSEAELLAMVDQIGVPRKWIQGHPTLSFGKHKNASWLHFDIAKGKRELALKNGAVAVDRYACLEHCARLDLKSSDPYIRAYGRRRLAMVLNVRKTPVFRFSETYYHLRGL